MGFPPDGAYDRPVGRRTQESLERALARGERRLRVELHPRRRKEKIDLEQVPPESLRHLRRQLGSLIDSASELERELCARIRAAR